MTEFEIALARAYLSASAQDPVAALIRSVKDLARIRRTLDAGGSGTPPARRRYERFPDACLPSSASR